MSRTAKTLNPESQVQDIRAALAPYLRLHPKAKIEVVRQNPVSVRIRVIDPDFQGKNRLDREPEVWAMLRTLPDETFQNITMLLLVSPKEAKNSLASQEFDDPIPSRL